MSELQRTKKKRGDIVMTAQGYYQVQRDGSYKPFDPKQYRIRKQK